MSLEYPRGEHQNAPEISRIEYGGFNTAGEKLVPYEVRALKDKTVVAAVRILEVSPMNKEDGAMFAHPQDAEFWAQCEGMQEATLVKRDYPNYPPSARTNREQGRVILYAVIEPDGSLSHATVIQRATPALEAAALEAISHWHYKPADCGQSPIRVETSIPVDFYVQY